MHELSLRGNVALEDAIAYGAGLLTNDSPVSGSDTGTWYLPRKTQTEHKFKLWDTADTVEVFLGGQRSLINDWPENENPFTQTDLLDDEEKQVQDLIFQIRASSYITCHERLAHRLLTLFNDAKEEDSACLGISAGSIRNFYIFLRLHTNLKCPTISLTPDYNIYASWRGEQKRLFSVHFLPDGDVRFVIFKPNDRHPERLIRLSGVATTDVLMKTVAPDSASDWISE